MRTFLSLSLMMLTLTVFGQKKIDKQAQAIAAEGKRLYQSEMASWYGTDLFIENYKQRENIGGYFSYLDKEIAKCIFFSKDDTPKVIGTISFDSTYNTKTAQLDFTERNFTKVEQDYYELRKIALKEIQSDTLFKTYKNTRLNLVPLIDKKEKKVYVLTGPKESGVVILGNDYLLTFNEKNEVKSKKQLHKNIITIKYENTDTQDSEPVESYHSHLPETGELMTATDICTIMLYGKFANWKTHGVISKKYMSVWNCQTNQIFVITTDAIKKINKAEENESDRK